jgi:hypothetical protein
MRLNPHALSVAILVVAASFLTTSCRESGGPPAPLSVEQMPGEFDKAFAKARPETKALASQVVAAVKSQDYAKALLDIQTLTSQSGLTKQQANLSARALNTVNGLLQTAQSTGDEKAKAVLEFQRINK